MSASQFKNMHVGFSEDFELAISVNVSTGMERTDQQPSVSPQSGCLGTAALMPVSRSGNNLPLIRVAQAMVF